MGVERSVMTGVRPSLGPTPLVLGSVWVRADADSSSTLFDALAYVAAGADGVVLAFGPEISPVDRANMADQVADAASVEVLVRSDVPMASSRHRLIVPLDSRTGSHLTEWQADGASAPGQSVLTLPAELDEGALIGSVVAAVEHGLAAVVTDRPRSARRTIDVVTAVGGALSDAGVPESSTARSTACP